VLQPVSSVFVYFDQNWGYISSFAGSLFYNVFKCILLFFSYISSLLLLFFLRLLI